MEYVVGSKEYFKGIGKIPYEGKDSKNPLAFKYYQADEMVEGNAMRDHLRFAVVFCAMTGNYRRVFESMTSEAV